MIDNTGERNAKALDGALGGYIQMQPRQGWELTLKIVGDRRRTFPERFSAIRTLRFYHGWKPAESKDPILRGLSTLVEDGEMADFAVEDLRRWKIWDLTPKVLAQYDKPSHASPIVRRGIIRYALCCPTPEAKQFVNTVRRQDPDLVRDLEEGLGFDRSGSNSQTRSEGMKRNLAWVAVCVTGGCVLLSFFAKRSRQGGQP
jgi:hypothetical protein